MIFLDTETVGFTGPVVLIQYATDDGPVTLHHVWKVPVRDTLKLIERFCYDHDGVCGFNLTYDWFHVNKLYNLLLASDPSKPPRVEEIVAHQSRHHRFYTTVCCRPRRALDLFLHARKSEYQTLMGRRNVYINKVPTDIAPRVIELLYKKLPLDDILFHYRQEGYKWNIEPIDEVFSNITLRFAPSMGLKPLCKHIFKVDTREFPIPNSLQPDEQEYNPYTTHWQAVIDYHINYWFTNKKAKGYAEDDILLLQRLYHHFNCPEPGDIDSELACCVGAVRWKGYAIDEGAILERLKSRREIIRSVPVNINAPHVVKHWLKKEANLAEKAFIKDTRAETLEAISKWDSSLAVKAQKVIAARKAFKEQDNLIKLLEAGRFCPNFKVIGAKSGRMSGGGEAGEAGKLSLNPQGIQHVKDFRKLFTLADSGYTLAGGDFDAFEVSIAHGACRDEHLFNDLKSGRKFHAVFGELLYDISYDEILSTKGSEEDLYHRAKTGAFAGVFYGAMPKKVAESTGVDVQSAKRAMEQIAEKYPKFASFREVIISSFCSMEQPGGIGTPVIWKEPAEYVKSLLGFRRYFTLENSICRALFELANGSDIPLIYGDVFRRKGKTQTKTGASKSALYAAAFQLQAANMRAALNHVIQATGAEICKHLQYEVWDLQPIGIHPWVSQPFQVHDEVNTVHRDQGDNLTECVIRTVEHFKELIPLIAIDWKNSLNNWGEK